MLLNVCVFANAMRTARNLYTEHYCPEGKIATVFDGPHVVVTLGPDSPPFLTDACRGNRLSEFEKSILVKVTEHVIPAPC